MTRRSLQGTPLCCRIVCLRFVWDRPCHRAQHVLRHCSFACLRRSRRSRPPMTHCSLQAEEGKSGCCRIVCLRFVWGTTAHRSQPALRQCSFACLRRKGWNSRPMTLRSLQGTPRCCRIASHQFVWGTPAHRSQPALRQCSFACLPRSWRSRSSNSLRSLQAEEGKSGCCRIVCLRFVWGTTAHRSQPAL